MSAYPLYAMCECGHIGDDHAWVSHDRTACNGGWHSQREHTCTCHLFTVEPGGVMIEYKDGMVISQLIAELERIKQDRGDIAAYYVVADTLATWRVRELEVCEAGIGIKEIVSWEPILNPDKDEPLRVVLS